MADIVVDLNFPFLSKVLAISFILSYHLVYFIDDLKNKSEYSWLNHEMCLPLELFGHNRDSG